MPFPQLLLDGYRAFRDGRLSRERELYRRLGESGQAPRIMVIGCCDSRAAPETIFDARPGELFVLRNIANVVPLCGADQRSLGVRAAVEFALAALKVRHVVVLGHAGCGGVKAFAERPPALSSGDAIGDWMDVMAPASVKAGPRGALSWHDYLVRLEQANVANSLDNLMTYPDVARCVERDALAVHGAHFTVATGELSVREEKTGAFVRLG